MNVDVVIVTYQSERYIERCITSLPASVTIYVVDNASEDASAERARQAGASVVVNEENIGFAAAANQGAALGDAEHILFLNPDAFPRAGCVERLVAELERDPSAALAGPTLWTMDGEEQRAWWPFPSACRSWLEAIGARRPSTSRGPASPDGVPFVVGACLLARRRAFEQVGGFDETFWLYAEEADLARRVADEGWRSLVVPDAACDHVGGASGTGSDRAFEEFQRGTERFIAKHSGHTALLSHRLALLTGSWLRLCALTAARRGGTARANLRRQIVQRLIRVLRVHPLSVPDSRRRRGLVVLSLEPWDEVWRRNQFLVRELLSADPDLHVLFVEPPVDLLHELVSRRQVPTLGGFRAGPLTERLTLFQPRKALPRVLGPAADRLLLRSVRGAMSTMGFDETTLWINDPAYAGAAAWDLPVVYDLTDDWTKADRPGRVHRRLAKWDRSLTSQADVVVACSIALADSHRHARDVRVIPNAVDAEHFRRPQTRPADLPPGPVAVYVGTLHGDRLDVALVADLARTLPQLRIALVGPDALTATERSGLLEHDNVLILGARPYAEVPGYLQHADVLVVPHVVSDFTATLDPIKAYECVAVGRPTVATPIAGFGAASSNIATADRSTFVDAVRRALATDGHSVSSKALPTWAQRAEDFALALRNARSSARRRLVVYVDHCAQLSGGEIALARLLDALDVRAHVILGENGPLVARLEETGATVEVLPFRAVARDLRRSRVRPTKVPSLAILESLRYSLRLAARLRELHPDLVHTNSLKAALYGGIAARLARRPVLIHVRDRIAPDYLPKVAVRTVRLFLRVVPSAVIANSNTTLATLRLPAGGAAVVPSPVVYDATPVIPQADRPSGAPFTAVIVGRLAPWKGQDVFIDAFAHAFGGGNERAIILGGALFGEHDYAAGLQRQIAALGLQERVELVGFHADVTPFLQRADVLVHASLLAEPFGQVVIEGLAAGVPVIAADAGGPTEIIEHGRTGLLVQPGDRQALAAAMRQLASDVALRERLSRAGLEHAKQFTPERVAALMNATYSAVLTKSR